MTFCRLYIEIFSSTVTVVCIEATTPTAPPSCRYYEFRCRDGSCIDERQRCDGRPDCPDGFDELECGQYLPLVVCRRLLPSHGRGHTANKRRCDPSVPVPFSDFVSIARWRYRRVPVSNAVSQGVGGSTINYARLQVLSVA